LGFGVLAQSPIPNPHPQSPNPHFHYDFLLRVEFIFSVLIYYLLF
jgi:hypothetical protein